MALFYKYAKTLNKIHALYKEGKSKEELSRLAEDLFKDTETSREEIKKAQEQLVIYAPFVERELAKPEYDGKRLTSLYFSMGLGTSEQIEIYNQVLDECIERYEIGEPLEGAEFNIKKYDPEEPDGEIISFVNMAKEVLKEETGLAPYSPLKALNNIVVPLDKLSTTLFDFYDIYTAKGDGQMLFTGSEAALVFAVNFDEIDGLTISKQFTPYDKLVFEIVGTFTKKYFESNRQGFPIISFNQIWKSMGNKGRPASSDLKKIEESINKMRHADITINNIYVDKDGENISEGRKTKYPKVNYTGRFLPADFIEFDFNGTTTDKAIILDKVPLLMNFAIERKQITTINVNLLEIDKSKMRRTEQTYVIQDYLIRRISEMKNTKNTTSNHIRFDTLIEKCRIDTKRHPERIWDKIVVFLSNYKDKEWIKDYKIINDTIEIFF